MRTLISVLALACGLSQAAQAAPPGLDPLPMVAVRATADLTTNGAVNGQTPLKLDELQAVSGGQGVTVNLLANQQLTGVTTGNSVIADTVTSGNVAFSSGALAGFSGVGNFVVNTGANNTLQGSISVNIITTPAP